jgi:hypothetical protein
MGIQPADFAGWRLKQCSIIICCCEMLAHQRYNDFGKLFAEQKDVNTASVRDLCLYKRNRVIEPVLN